MSIPEISVIMPAYNAEKYIVDSITSVLKQSFSSWELIIVDDGSTDRTAEIAGGFLPDQRITLIRQTNKGVSAARNAGIKASKGNFLTFLDADDAYMPENLSAKYEAINADSSLDYIYSDVMLCDVGLGNRYIEKGASSDKVRKSVISRQPENIPGFSSNIMVRGTTVKNQNIYFDTNLSNCADQYYKILLVSGCTGAYIAQPLAKYRNTPNSMSKNIFLLEHDELYILDKIKEKNIIPESNERNKAFAKIYLMLSGSWYRDAGKTGRAIRFALMALFTYPGILFRLLNKGFVILFQKKKN
jgi:glycosyltransferase involved in cell wall biosynthesis